MRTALDTLLAIGALAVLSTAARGQCAVDSLADASVNQEDHFGLNLAVGPDCALVSSLDGSVVATQGAISVFERTAAGFTLTQKLAPKSQQASNFGKALDLDGTVAVIGAPGANFAPGLVYVAERGPSGWELTAELLPSDGVKDWDFGEAVALSGDTLVVGSPVENGSAPSAGAVYVFERSGGAWVEVQKLVAPDGGPNQTFGSSVAIDGDVILVGAQWAHGAMFDTGAMYSFERRSTGFELGQKLWAAGGTPLDRFGVALDFDGARALVGGHGADFNVGAAWVFDFDGASWTEVTELRGSSADEGSFFGLTLTLHGDFALVGAPSFSLPGAAYLFRWDGASWTESAELLAPGSSVDDRFGAGVGIDGDRVVVGAPGLGGPLETGIAYSFSVGAHFDALTSETDEISVSAGGMQLLRINTCLAEVGATYWVLGSTHGSAGAPFGGVLLPLTADRYFAFTSSSPNTPPLLRSFGPLDGQAQAIAAFVLPPGAGPNLVGLELVHAFALFDPLRGDAFFASNAVGLRLVP